MPPGLAKVVWRTEIAAHVGIECARYMRLVVGLAASGGIHQGITTVEDHDRGLPQQGGQLSDADQSVHTDSLDFFKRLTMVIVWQCDLTHVSEPLSALTVNLSASVALLIALLDI